MQILKLLAGIQSQVEAIARLMQNFYFLFLFNLNRFILQVLDVVELLFDFLHLLVQIVFFSVHRVCYLLLELLFSSRN
jgi:hypothetical protein